MLSPQFSAAKLGEASTRTKFGLNQPLYFEEFGEAIAAEMQIKGWGRKKAGISTKVNPTFRDSNEDWE